MRQCVWEGLLEEEESSCSVSRSHKRSCFIFPYGLRSCYLHPLINILNDFICQDVSEKAMAPRSSTLAWKIPWMEKPGRLQSMGLLRVGHDWATSLWLFTFMQWRRIPGMGELGGLPSMGLHRVGHNWNDLLAAAAVFVVKKNKTKQNKTRHLK